MNEPVNPMSMPISDAALLLTKAGGRRITEDLLREAVEAGLPVDTRGHLNVITLAAWLNREMTHGNESA